MDPGAIFQITSNGFKRLINSIRGRQRQITPATTWQNLSAEYNSDQRCATVYGRSTSLNFSLPQCVVSGGLSLMKSMSSRYPC